MSIRVFVLATAMLSPLSVLASACPADNPVLPPPDFEWADQGDHFSATLFYAEYTHRTPDGKTLTTRAYGQKDGESFTLSIPGPTMRMTPGNKYVVRYENLLPYEEHNPEHNVFKDANISNLHTHGLHISGETPGDDVTRFFEGGFGGDFVYDIPADHMGGTYWYHAHHHGSTFLQVSTGGFGLIIIDDGNDGIPPEVAAMTEREVIIGFLDPDNAGVSGDTLVSGDLGPTWTVNGAVNGDMCVPVNEWQHWRVLLADADSRPKDVAIDGDCEVELLARDGVWRTTAPKAIPTNTISLTGASRADLAVRCQSDATISVGNTVVANVYADGPGNTNPNPFGTANGTRGDPWSADRPDYLRDLRQETVDNTETVRMGARTINGSKFNMTEPTFALKADALQQWSLNGAQQHPFHLHVYHVQVDGACGEFEDGEYYDVIANNCTLRFDLDTRDSTIYEGRTIMHCHILEHEDQGAMGWLDVQPSLAGGVVAPIGAPEFPGDVVGERPYSDRYALDASPGVPPAAPSGLLATAVSSGQIDLDWTDNSDNESAFEIERSTDGTSFGLHNTTSANVTSFADTGLAADTQYWYQVRATNADGDSDYTNVADATTGSSAPGALVRIRSLAVSVVGQGQGQKGGFADIVVEDDQGNLVADATVTGDFSGTFDEPGVSSAPTDEFGSTFIETTGTAKGKVSVTFCVTSITHPDLDDFSGRECASN
jgi:FtsP/CotA-like multicopper oxidase with cupredoxin domain